MGITPLSSFFQKFPHQFLDVNYTEWEERILITLDEWLLKNPPQRATLFISGMRVIVIGNHTEAIQELEKRYPKVSGVPRFSAYYLNGIRHFSTLRRLKDFPDETNQAELEIPAIFYSAGCNGFLSLNGAMKR